VPKVKGICAGSSRGALSPAAVSPGRTLTPAAKLARPVHCVIYIVAVGTSTGGPNALAKVLPSIPQTFPVPIVIVQHMPPVFTRLLAECLNRDSAIQIREGEKGAVLKPGEAWIAPGKSTAA
jgi:two-component system, chemotaxis family, protein-glutamate methylesterase/glutaminase